MKKLLFTCALAAAGVASAQVTGGNSIIGGFGLPQHGSTPEQAVSNLYDVANGFVSTPKDDDTDKAYSFQLTLDVAERSAVAPQLSEFVEDLPDGVHYFEAKKKTIKGQVWTKARPSWLVSAVLNAMDSASAQKYAKYIGILPDVRAISLWDSRACKYVQSSLFYFGAVGMGKKSKDSLGLLIGAFGADTEYIAEYYTEMNLTLEEILKHLEGQTGLILGLGIGRTQINKTNRFVSTLSGNCMYAAVDVDDMNAEGAFYNVYTGEAIQVPLNAILGFGDWQLKANNVLSKKLLKQDSEADKLAVFEKACYKRPYGEFKMLDQWKLVLAAAVAGDGPKQAKALIEASYTKVGELIVEHAADAAFVEKAQAVRAFYAELMDYCDQAADAGIHDPAVK